MDKEMQPNICRPHWIPWKRWGIISRCVDHRGKESKVKTLGLIASRFVVCHSMSWLMMNVSGYVCNHGSPSGERDTASPRGRYGERPQRDSVWRYICKKTTCWPATAHDVTTGVPQYKCRRENTSSASSSEACVRSMAQSLGDAVSRSPLGEPWLHT